VQIALAGSAIEALLGKPVVPASWIDMPEDSFETGALPLEEEILQDEVELARRTFAARVREWRTSVSLTPLDAVRTSYEQQGITIASVEWSGLADLSDEELDYCFAVAKRLGASTLSTPLVVGLPRRLTPFAERHAMRVQFAPATATV